MNGLHFLHSVLGRVKYEAAFFTLFLVYFQCQLPPMDVWRTDGWWLGGFWYITYGLGFVQRGLAGSVVALFCDRLGPAEINQIVAGCWLALALWTAVFCGWLARRTSEEDRPAMLYLIVIFLVMPCSFTQYCNSEMFGKLDMFHAPVLLGAAWLIVQNRMLYVVPLLVAVGILIHPSFFFLYFPSVFLLLGHCTRWRARVLLAGTALAGVGLFVSLQCAGKPDVGLDGVTAYMTGRGGDGAVSEAGFFYAYFATLSDHLALFAKHGVRPIANALWVFLAVLPPVWLLLAWIWRGVICRGGAEERGESLWLCLGPLAFAVPVFLALDWMRWLSSLMVCQFAVLFALHAEGCPAVRAAVSDLGLALRRRPFFFGCLALGLAILPRAEVSGLLLNPGFTSLLKSLGLSI